jgi:hypothetical protein
MGFLSRFRRRHEELDKRLASAIARAETAGKEVARSQARQKHVREHVVAPLQRAAEHNQFASMIEASLAEGRRRGA